ncbi:MAG: hypothetical protein HY372_03365 [Candidatus Andersenbacteria bacterium]|nr:hypothetical protein [Candidatus Andersenbacteria bacterium]
MPRLFGIALLVAGGVALTAQAVWSAAAASVFADLGPGMSYTPLVRHQISQRHCYDDGSFFCEEARGEKPAFSKEFTLGYLFEKSRQLGLGLAPLYACQDTGRRGLGRQFILADTVDGDARRVCRSFQMHPQRLGYVAREPLFEAAQALYRCWGGEFDTLLTDDPNECTLSGYLFTERLGYIVAGGTLPLRRLAELCETSSSPHCQFLEQAFTEAFAANGRQSSIEQFLEER